MKVDKETIDEILYYKDKGLSNREIARNILGRDSRESTIRNILKRQINNNISDHIKSNDSLRVVALDVEVSPTLAWSFSRRKAFISPSAVEVEPYMLSFAYQFFLEDDNVCGASLADFKSFDNDIKDDYELIVALWEVVDKADYVIAHKAKFDNGWFNQRLVYHGLPLPSPYRVLDTLQYAKKYFSLPSNSLEAIGYYFKLEELKRSNEGISLWVRCCNGDRNAFEDMLYYNKGDIPPLVSFFKKIMPFITDFSIKKTDLNSISCHKCLSKDLTEQPDKKYYTKVSKFSVYRCNDCGSFFRGRKNLSIGESSKLISL